MPEQYWFSILAPGPTEWNKQRDEEEAALQDTRDEADLAITLGVSRSKDINQLETILNSKALDTVVGPTYLTRGLSRKDPGFISTPLSLVSKVFNPTLQGLDGFLDEFSSADDFIALTEQITSQEFLNKLVAEKGKGATFGQLSDREGDALRSAALAVNQTAIHKGGEVSGKVIGYDMSEKEFKNQLTILQTEIKRLYQKTTGDVFTFEEKAELEALDDALSPGQFNPAF